jgi:predicted ester cyclase
MEANEYKLFLKRYVEQVWERGNLVAIGKYVSTDCIYHDSAFPYTLDGPKVIADYIFHFRSALQDWHFQVEDVVGEGNTIAVRWTVQGIHQALLGQLPPTGHPVQLTGVTLYRLRGSKIIEAWNCWNRIGLVKLRTVFCACGARLVALDDATLFQVYRHHADTAHREDQFSVTDEQIRAVIAGSVHELTRPPQEPDLARAHGAA